MFVIPANYLALHDVPSFGSEGRNPDSGTNIGKCRCGAERIQRSSIAHVAVAPGARSPSLLLILEEAKD